MASLLRTRRALVALLATATATATAAGAQTLPPVRPLGPVIRVSATDMLGSVSTVRPLPSGRILVNDLVRRQLVLLDSTLALEVMVADTTPATANAYSSRAAGLIAFRGDSSLFIDPQSLSMLLIDGNGTVVRVMAVPRPNDAMFMVGGPFGTPAFDGKGRIVYRGMTRPNMPAPGSGAPGSAGFRIPEQPDSAPILRVALDTRTLDTASFFKIPKTSVSVRQNDRGMMTVSMTMNPMPVVDDWALLPDGTLAVVRGADYHVDFLAPDGARSSSPKIPFEWQRMTDELKLAFLDSTRTAVERMRSAAAASGGTSIVVGSGPGGAAAAAPAVLGAMAGGSVVMQFGGPIGGPPASVAGTAAAGAPAGGIAMPAMNMVAPSELPDYRPAFGTGATRADLDGNLWIRTSKLVDGAPVYDVVNRAGSLTERVKLPAGRVIIGFGTNVVYMGVRDEKGARLEVARIR